MRSSDRGGVGASGSLWDRRAWRTAVPVALAAAVALLPCLKGGFVDWDDDYNFINNPHYRGLGWGQVAWAWRADLLGVYQPLSWMLFSAEYVAWGLNPSGYHLTSLLLHAANAVVLDVLILALLARRRPDGKGKDEAGLRRCAALAAALFAVHPLRVEVVAWASCQPYLPCALFAMLAVLAYLHAHRDAAPARPAWVVGSFVLLALALLCKATAAGVAAVLPILDVYPLRRLGGGSGGWFGPGARRTWAEKVPFGLLTIASLALAARARRSGGGFDPMDSGDLATAIARACYAACLTLEKTFLPVGLSAFYPLPERFGLTEPRALICTLLVVGVTAGLILARRRWPGLLAAWASFLVVLAPTSGLARFGQQAAADRYSYLATIPGAVLLAAGLDRLGRPGLRSRQFGAATTAAALGVVAVLIALSWRQCLTWRDSEALWTHTLAHGGDRSDLVLNNWGATLARRGRLREATVFYARAVRLNPRNVGARFNLGASFSQLGRHDEAIVQYAEVLRRRPDHVEAHYNLGLALSRRGRLAEAEPHLAEAVRLRPDFVAALSTWGAVLAQLGRSDEGERRLAEALRLRPDYLSARVNLGNALLGRGRPAEAAEQFSAALRIDPESTAARRGLEQALRAGSAPGEGP